MSIDGKYAVPTVAVHTDIFLKQMQNWFAENMSSVKTRFVPIRNVYTRDDPETWEEIRRDCDAAIIGVGH